MTEPAKSELFAEFLEGFGEVRKILESQNLRMKVHERQIISEAAIFLHEMLEQVGLDKTEEAFANSWLQQFCHVLGRGFEGNFILGFHYFDRNYRKEPEITTQTMISLVLALRAMETCGFKLPRTGTVWKYLERDMPKFRKELERMLDKNSAEVNVNELFLLLNTIDMLASIKESQKLAHEFKEFMKLGTKYKKSFEKGFEVSPGLAVYSADLANRINLPIQINKLPSELNDKTAAFSMLMRLRRGENFDPDQIEHPYYSSAPHLWWTTKAWARRQSGQDLIGILPFYRGTTDMGAISRLIWGDLEALSKIDVSDEDMERVLNFTDREIKHQLYHYFQKHPNITDNSRTGLGAERDKEHGPGEITDFNVEFFTGGENIWAAIVIKSGRETGAQNRDKIELKFLYQFLRPLFSLGPSRTAVFPIILVKPTLNVTEFLSQMNAHLKLPFLVLDIKIYTQFLKREKLLNFV